MNAQKANNTIDKVQQLQRNLYRAAKENSKRRFHALFDKVYREDILAEAWKRVKANGGSGGIDCISIANIEAYGVEKLLAEIVVELKAGIYRPRPVRRVYIPKADGKQRPLGIPVIKDRIVQMAAKLVLEPIFEADFKSTSYGFRPKRSAHQALESVRNAYKNHGWWVVEVDIQSYFDNINHDKLMKMVGMRINDRRILKLLRHWLTAGVMTEGRYEETRKGSPQGGVISPLLSNLYLHYLDAKWEKRASHLGTLVRYADDMIVVCQTKNNALQALNFIKAVMQRLELTLHPDKTQLVSMWEGQGGFDFLGMHHRCITAESSYGKWYKALHQFPSKKAMIKMRTRIGEILGNRNVLGQNVNDLVKSINPILIGWKNYYGLKTAKKWLAKVDWHILKRFVIWYNKKTKGRRHLSDMRKVREILMTCKLRWLAE